MHSVLCFTELGGLLLSITGHFCCVVALFIPHWLTFSSGMLVNESYMLGLWKTCVNQDVGSSVCQDYRTLLDLPPQIQMGRVLMCLSVSSGALGFMVSTPALTCVKCLHDSEYCIRRTLIIFGGILFLLAGALTISIVSYIAYDTLGKFWDLNIPKDVPRWEYGKSMFFGWIGGFLLLVGGSVIIISQFYISQASELTRPQPVETNQASSYTEYV
ncbi:putative claudin-24 [Rhinophrynus dorsalis]